MNLEKIHNTISKAVFTLNAHKLGMDDTHEHFIIGDSYHCYRIPKHDFLFSVRQLLSKGIKEVRAFTRVFENIPDTPAIKTGNLKDGFKANYPFIELNADGELIYIDTQLLKNFDKSCTFTGTKHNAPVYVWESGECVGLVLPVHIKN